jgi:hypothetical protein
MPIAALVTWIVTESVGFFLLARWFAGGGLRHQPTKVTRFPITLVISHPLLAVIGLASWVLYLVFDESVYAWIAFGVLIVVALLGLTMLTRWLMAGGGRHARAAQTTFPAVAVIAHGVLALATLILVFLSAVGLPADWQWPLNWHL